MRKILIYCYNDKIYNKNIFLRNTIKILKIKYKYHKSITYLYIIYIVINRSHFDNKITFRLSMYTYVLQIIPYTQYRCYYNIVVYIPYNNLKITTKCCVYVHILFIQK